MLAVVFAQVFVVFMPVRRAEKVARRGAAVYDLEAAFGRFGFNLLLFEKFVRVIVDRRLFCRSFVFERQVERLRAEKGLYHSAFVGEVFRQNNETVVLFEHELGDVEELIGALRVFHYVGELVERGVVGVEENFHREVEGHLRLALVAEARASARFPVVGVAAVCAVEFGSGLFVELAVAEILLEVGTFFECALIAVRFRVVAAGALEAAATLLVEILFYRRAGRPSGCEFDIRKLAQVHFLTVLCLFVFFGHTVYIFRGCLKNAPAEHRRTRELY